MMAKKARTAAEIAYHGRVAELGCILCRLLYGTKRAASIHHIRTGQGAGQRASHWLVVPLCPECHQGKRGVHGDKSMLRIAKVEELDLLALTIQRLAA